MFNCWSLLCGVSNVVAVCTTRGQVSESETDLGKIQVTVRYSAQRSRLVAVVHKCV